MLTAIVFISFFDEGMSKFMTKDKGSILLGSGDDGKFSSETTIQPVVTLYPTSASAYNEWGHGGRGGRG